MSEVETVYGYLVVRLSQAFRQSDRDLQEKIISALELFEALWPDECKKWNDRFPSWSK